MKRTFLAKRNALLSSSGASWGVVALVCALLTLLLRLIAPNFFWNAFTPLFRSADTITAASHIFFNSFGDTAALATKNEQLVKENAALANENTALLQKTIDLEGFKHTVPREGRELIAGVIARPPSSPYDTLVLAQGSTAGVVLGQEAFGEGGVPLGVVTSVLADFSRVTLFSSPTMQIDGWIGDAHLPLSLQGAGAGAWDASVARSAGIAVGDTVFVPGPGRLPLGQVIRIDSDTSSPSVVLRIQSAFNPFSITWVLLRDTGTAFANALSWPSSSL